MSRLKRKNCTAIGSRLFEAACLTEKEEHRMKKPERRKRKDRDLSSPTLREEDIESA